MLSRARMISGHFFAQGIKLLPRLKRSGEKNFCAGFRASPGFLPSKKLVQIQLCFTVITFHSTPENLIAAFRTNVAGFFILNPFFSTNLSPVGNSPQNNFLSNSHWKIFNVLTRKFVTLMTPGVTLLSCAGPDLTLPAMHKLFIR